MYLCDACSNGLLSVISLLWVKTSLFVNVIIALKVLHAEMSTRHKCPVMRVHRGVVINEFCSAS